MITKKNLWELNMDYYYRKDLNLLYQHHLFETATVYQWQNAIGILIKGIEISIHGSIIKYPHFQWETEFNLARNYNYLIKCPDDRDFFYTLF